MVHGQVALDIKDQLRAPVRTTRHSTEQTLNFTNISASKDCFKYSFLPRTVSEWNNLPAAVRDAKSTDTFKLELSKLNIKSIIQKSHFV